MVQWSLLRALERSLWVLSLFGLWFTLSQHVILPGEEPLWYGMVLAGAGAALALHVVSHAPRR